MARRRPNPNSDAIYDVPPAGYMGGGATEEMPLAFWVMVVIAFLGIGVLAIAGLADPQKSRPGAIRLHEASWFAANPQTQRAPEDRTVFISDPSMEAAVQTVFRKLAGKRYREIHEIAHPALKEAYTEDEFRRYMRDAIRNIGTLESAHLMEIDTYSMPVEMGGRQAVLRYGARFEGGHGILLLTMGLDGDEWRPMEIEIK